MALAFPFLAADAAADHLGCGAAETSEFVANGSATDALIILLLVGVVVMPPVQPGAGVVVLYETLWAVIEAPQGTTRVALVETLQVDAEIAPAPLITMFVVADNEIMQPLTAPA